MTRSRLLVPLVAVGLGLGLAACGENAPPSNAVTEQQQAGDANGDFSLDTAVIGSRQSVRATVEQVLSPSSFTITAADAGGEPLLVLGGSGSVAPGQQVQLAGILRVFSYDEFAADFTLGSPDVYAGLSNRKVLVADTVDTDLPQGD